MKEFIKIGLLLLILAEFITALSHLFFAIIGFKVPYEIYILMALFVIAVMLLMIIIKPFIEWWENIWEDKN